MKKYTSYAMAIVLCVAMAGAAFAAIESSGGTENFESVSLDDGTQFTNTNIDNISGWSFYTECAGFSYYFDNDDTSTFSSASGAGTKPTGNKNIHIYTIAAEETNYALRSTSTNLGRDVIATFWFAVKTVNASKDVRVGLHFTGADERTNKGTVHLHWASDTKDISLAVKMAVSGAAEDEKIHAGTVTGEADDSDYDLNTWNKVEIKITTSESAEGTAEFYLNGSKVGDTVAIAADPSGNLVNCQFLVLAWKLMTACDIYIDDITVEAGTSSIDHWRLY